MTDVKKQWIFIKFCFKIGKMAAETQKMIKEAFGDNALVQTQTYKWFKWLKKALQIQSYVKSTLIGFLDIEGIMHKEFVPPGKLVNGKFCCAILRRLRENIQTSCTTPGTLHHSPPSLLTGPHPLSFFPLPKDEIEA